MGASARIWLQNKEALRYLAQALLEKSAAEARDQRWSRAAGYAAAARVNDDTAEARWRAAQRGSVQVDPVWRLELPSGVDALGISRDGAVMAAGLSDHTVALLDNKGRTLRSLEGHDGKLTALVFSPDGQTLISAGEDRQLLAWGVSSGDRLARLESDARIRDVAFSADGTLHATAAAEGYIR